MYSCVSDGTLPLFRMPHMKLEMWANVQRDGRPANIRGALRSTPQSLADAHY